MTYQVITGCTASQSPISSLVRTWLNLHKQCPKHAWETSFGPCVSCIG